MDITADSCVPSATAHFSLDCEVASPYYSDSQIDSICDTDEILCGEDLEVNSLCYTDSEIDTVLDPDEILRGEDLEVDSLCFESVLNTDDMYAEETPCPSSPPTSPSPMISVLSVEVQVADTIAAAEVESGASSENNVLVGEVMHVPPKEKVSEAREQEVDVEIETEVSAAVRRRRSKRKQGRASSVGVSSRTRSCRERATRSNVRAGRATLFPGVV